MRTWQYDICHLAAFHALKLDKFSKWITFCWCYGTLTPAAWYNTLSGGGEEWRQAWRLLPAGTLSVIDAEIKQMAPCQRTIIFIVTLEPLCSPGLEMHQNGASLSTALHLVVPPVLNCPFVLWEHSWEKRSSITKRKQSKGLIALELCLHLEPTMGQSQRHPTEVIHTGAMPPSPRTVCTLHLDEPSHRFLCPYHHFSYLGRAMNSPYSPGLFKTPDRR